MFKKIIFALIIISLLAGCVNAFYSIHFRGNNITPTIKEVVKSCSE